MPPNKLSALRARDGVALCFFMRRSHPEVAAAVWWALQVYPENMRRWLRRLCQ